MSGGGVTERALAELATVERWKNISLRLPASHWARLVHVAEKNRVTPSALLRKIVEISLRDV